MPKDAPFEKNKKEVAISYHFSSCIGSLQPSQVIKPFLLLNDLWPILNVWQSLQTAYAISELFMSIFLPP